MKRSCQSMSSLSKGHGDDEKPPGGGGWREALTEAAQTGDRARVEAVFARLDFKNDNGADGWGWMSDKFQDAAYFGNNVMVRLLVKAGVDVNSIARLDRRATWTALHLAVCKNRVSTVKLLLALGADTTILQYTRLRPPQTSMDLARKKGHSEIVKVLEEHLASRSLIDKLRSRADGEKQLNEAVCIQEKLKSLRSLKHHIEEELAKADETCKEEIKQMEERFELAKETLREEFEGGKSKLEEDLKAAAALLKAERDKVAKALSDLEALPDFKNEDQIEEMRAEHAELSSLNESLKEIVSPNVSGIKSCPVCVQQPEQVFSCTSCDVWFCGGCKDQFANCPKCRQDFGEVPPMRSSGIEGLLARL